ncbi:Uncharacterised protein [Escherichia coli]|nr:Uncharacterised protein [Escherichia coli]
MSIQTWLLLHNHRVPHSSSAGLPALHNIRAERKLKTVPVTFSPWPLLWEAPGFSRLLPSVSSSAMPNRPAFTPVTFRWPGRAASSVPLKVRVTILPTAVAWQFSSLMTNDSVGERPGGYQKSLDARVLKTTCLFRLSPDTWQGLSSRLPLNAHLRPLPARQTVQQTIKERLCFLSSHSLTHILCSDAAWPDCSWHQNTHPPVSPFSSRRPASPPAAGQAGTVKRYHHRV